MNDGPTTKKVTLCNGVSAGAVRIYLDATISESSIVLSGEDVGEAIRGVMGGSSREYHLAVERKFIDAMLLALLEVHTAMIRPRFPR